jgi:FtsP/CotA-like multicopper oxidase with cupredoxin domain
MDRRRFIKLAGAAGAMAAGLPASARAARSAADLELDLVAARDRMRLLPGAPTTVWRYSAENVSGRSGAVTDMPGSYLGPILRVKRGERVRLRFRNKVPEPSIIHWHGLHVPPEDDGHPRYAVEQGGEYQYDFTVNNRAGTYWYHPHPHGLTGHQVYGGMAGLFIVEDEEESALGLPSGEYDLPLVIQDRSFGPDNELIYLRSPMDRMNGFLGDRILVNGSTETTLGVASRPYRLRVLNGCNSRNLRLAFSDGRPLTVIGTDGGLLEKPLVAPEVMMGPAERADLWVDFSGMKKGRRLSLVSAPFRTSGGMGRMGMMGGGSRLPEGAGYALADFRVEREAGGGPTLHERLSRIEYLDPGQAVNVRRPRRFLLEVRHMAMTINGRSFRMTEVAPDEKVRLGDLEIWEFVNAGGAGMGMMGGMAMPHPMHVHGLQFQVVERSGGPGYRHLDEGWKDSVLVHPGERVAVAMRFTDYTGMYLYHCHNLEHEDMGMMRNYLVEG